MLEYYRHLPEHIDPIVFSVGFFSLRWYALMYVSALCVSGYILWRQTRGTLSFDRYIDLVFDLILGVLIGSRLGYVILYNLPFYVAHPLAVVWPFDSLTGEWIGIAGMSYYGGMIGVIVGLRMFSRRVKMSFWRLADAAAFAVPIGYFFGRIGNFLNGELYGRVTEKAWGMYFPDAMFGNVILRHPSQMYEAFFEGAVLFLVLVHVRKKYLFPGAVAAAYAIGYGFFRFCIEFFREPDPQTGLVFGWMTLGQIVSSIACVIGIGLFFWLRGKKYGTIKT